MSGGGACRAGGLFLHLSPWPIVQRGAFRAYAFPPPGFLQSALCEQSVSAMRGRRRPGGNPTGRGSSRRLHGGEAILAGAQGQPSRWAQFFSSYSPSPRSVSATALLLRDLAGTPVM